MFVFVNTPIANLRKEPIAAQLNYNKDRLQESQVIYGEQLIVKEEKDGWLFVEAIEQKKYLNGKWQGYPGWIEANQVISVQSPLKPNLVIQVPWVEVDGHFNLTIGVQLFGVKKDQDWVIEFLDGSCGKIKKTLVNSDFGSKPSGHQLLTTGLQFLGIPYLWGGRSFYNTSYQKCVTSVDCSALINLIYRCYGIEVPRDAHDQFLFSIPKEPAQLQVGDLIFLSEKERMTHVMLYAGEEMFLEASMQSGCVRLISCVDKLGLPLAALKSGQILPLRKDAVEEEKVWFGSILTCPCP